MDWKLVFSEKINIELYNFSIHQIYIIWWHHTEKYIWKYFPIYFQYILTLTSPSPLVFEKVVHCELTASTAMLFSSVRPFIWYTYLRWSRGCKQFRWRWFQKLTTDSDSGVLTTPETIEKCQKFDWVFKFNFQVLRVLWSYSDLK